MPVRCWPVGRRGNDSLRPFAFDRCASLAWPYELRSSTWRICLFGYRYYHLGSCLPHGICSFPFVRALMMSFPEDVDEVVAPGLQGYFGVLPGHVPFLTSLQSGEVSYRIGRTEQYLAVRGGFAEVQGDRVTILAERAERPEE